jgi:hypothetical protein
VGGRRDGKPYGIHQKCQCNLFFRIHVLRNIKEILCTAQQNIFDVAQNVHVHLNMKDNLMLE